jgi:hypothetical protein
MRNGLPLASYSPPLKTKKPSPVLYDGRVTAPPVGALAATDTLALCEAEPPLPVQLNVKVFAALSAPVDRDPLDVTAPDHPPDAVQAVALVEDQVNVELAPLETLVGLALIETLGGMAGGVELSAPLTELVLAGRLDCDD